MATLSNPIFYQSGNSGASAVVSFESMQNRVVRYDLNLDSGEQASHINVLFDEDSGSISIGSGADQFTKINAELSFYFAISTDPEAFANAGYGDISSATGKADFALYRGSVANGDAHYKVTCDADIALYSDTQYYFWVFPGFSNATGGNGTWGWVWWGRSLTITTTLSGVAATYTVAYDAAGGSREPEDQTKNHGEDLVLSDMVPTKKGHSFLGWAITAGGEVAYQPGDTYATDAAVTLYAVWKVNQYTDTFDPNGGTGGGSFAGDYGSSYTAPTATRPGYLISGWWSATTGGSKVANPGQTITHNANNDTAYAQWKVRTYTISCNPNGGAFQGSEQATQLTTKLHSGSIASIGAAEKGITTEEWAVNLDPNGGSCLAEKVVTGGTVAHIFAGWYDKQGNRVYDENGDCVEGIYWQSGKWVYDDDLQMSAWYRKDPVEFTPVELPKAERAGYRFLGWSADPQDQETVDDSYVPQSEGITLYAVWEALTVEATRAQVLVYARGRFRPYRVLVKSGNTVTPCILRLETRPTPLTATHDGAGTVTLHGNVSAIYEGNGTVRLVGASVAKYEDGTVTIKGGIR